MSHHIRPRSNGRAFELRIKHKLLPKPAYMTCDSEDQALKLAKRYEDSLDRGIVPIELLPREKAPFTDLAGAIQAYEDDEAVPRSTSLVLATITKDIGDVPLVKIDFPWCKDWIRKQKLEKHRAPVTIRHHVGALSRCLHWVTNMHPKCLPDNPLARLTRGYSSYNRKEKAVLIMHGIDPKEDEYRDRRFEPEEEARILALIDERITNAQEPQLKARYVSSKLMLLLALETAMRMRELYTLTVDKAQIDIASRTIFLSKTKNGQRRQVPISSVAVRLLEEALPDPQPERKGGLLFPFWDGDWSPEALERTTSEVSRYFGELFRAAGCDDLHFHDARHEGVCKFVLRTTLPETAIARATGFSDPRTLRRYLSLRGSEIADFMW